MLQKLTDKLAGVYYIDIMLPIPSFLYDNSRIVTKTISQGLKCCQTKFIPLIFSAAGRYKPEISRF